MALPFTKFCKKWKSFHSTIVLFKKKIGGGLQNNRFMEKWKVFPFFYKFKKKLHAFFQISMAIHPLHHLMNQNRLSYEQHQK